MTFVPWRNNTSFYEIVFISLQNVNIMCYLAFSNKPSKCDIVKHITVLGETKGVILSRLDRV
jgi:hypothetical protein